MYSEYRFYISYNNIKLQYVKKLKRKKKFKKKTLLLIGIINYD